MRESPDTRARRCEWQIGSDFERESGMFDWPKQGDDEKRCAYLDEVRSNRDPC